jgi:hypothetical protein
MAFAKLTWEPSDAWIVTDKTSVFKEIRVWAAEMETWQQKQLKLEAARIAA